jgi:predicted nuclease of predicted toxin-antitoxin system
MRVLLDENLPVGLATLLAGDHQIFTIAGLRWHGVSNGELLARMEGRFDVLLTMDRGIRYQQVLRGRPFSVLALRAPSNRLADLRALVPHILSALENVEQGTVRTLGA